MTTICTATAGESGYSCFLEYLESSTKVTLTSCPLLLCLYITDESRHCNCMVLTNWLQELDQFGNEIPLPHEDSLISLARHILDVSDIVCNILRLYY